MDVHSMKLKRPPCSYNYTMCDEYTEIEMIDKQGVQPIPIVKLSVALSSP